MITDTHTHLYLKEFAEDIDDVINRALNLRINNFFLPAIDSSHTESMIALKTAYPKIMHLMAGLHPCSVKENYLDENVNNIWSDDTIDALGRDHEIIKTVRLKITKRILDVIEDTLSRLGMF